jgi:hemin uptake protein HemP
MHRVHPTSPTPPGGAGSGLAAPGAAPVAGGTIISSVSLLQGGKSVTIEHNGERYRLQATRQGKLILTK